jgi:ATP-binding cassette subfamily C protein LapB
MERLGLTSFVDGLHRGVMTRVGAAGVRVSPGIAARIGLLRALVRRPMILCLDEVSGALDLDGMRRLVAMLRGLKGHVTIFLISGRAELLELADQMIKIKRVASK